MRRSIEAVNILTHIHISIHADGRLRCRNYGCNQNFTEAENSDAACRFHTAPPVFHDTKKGWSCCPKRVYDWDEFNLVRRVLPFWVQIHVCVDRF